MNNYFLKALNQENEAPYIPVWLLRQAGRYMPEYREVRSQYKDFFEMIKKPEICKELTLQPLNAFDLDAAITFTDILTIPDALGLKVNFVKGKGPIFEKSLSSMDKIDLNTNEFHDKIHYVYSATSLIKENVNVPLIGFTGSPWTLFVYMFYGQSPKDFKSIQSYISENSRDAETYLQILTDCCIEYAKKQVQHGADCIQIFDSWAGILENNYVDFSLKYVNQIYEALNEEVPLILYNRGKLLSSFVDKSAFKAYSINSSDRIENYIDENITIQGNLNPVFFKKNQEEIELKAREIFTKFKDRKNYIFNVGEGLTPDLDPEKIKIFLKTLRSLNSQ
ncbi:MAG: uroporphyrinogen decarboxylase [Gammaproteobacteria bacterium]